MLKIILRNLVIIIAILFLLGSFTLIYEDTNSYFKELKNGLLGVVIVIMGTASIVVYQYFLEDNNRKKQLVFERKINFYNEALDKFDEIFSNQLDDYTNRKLIFQVSRGMLIASPNAADKLAQLSLAIMENKETYYEIFKEFILEARKDLDLMDRISHGNIDTFDPILSKLENLWKKDVRKLRYFSEEEKQKIINQYDKQKNNKIKWLKEKHGVYYSQIANWRKQLTMQSQEDKI
jgi:hypothetical protein